MENKEQKLTAEIIKAYIRIREIDNTIPDDILDLMKNSAIASLSKEGEVKDGFEAWLEEKITYLQGNTIRHYFNRETIDFYESVLSAYQSFSPPHKESEKEETRGLFNKYFIQKRTSENGVFKQVDKNAEYFVLRLDNEQKDKNHLNACRIGVNAYANAIEPYIPELAKDLKAFCPVSQSDVKMPLEITDEQIESEAQMRVTNNIGNVPFPINKKWFIKGAKWMRLQTSTPKQELKPLSEDCDHYFPMIKDVFQPCEFCGAISQHPRK